MTKYMTKDEERIFWEKHEEARAQRDKKLARLPFSEKLAILERLKIDCEVLQNAKEELVGLRMPNSACNTLPADCSSTGVDWWLNVQYETREFGLKEGVMIGWILCHWLNRHKWEPTYCSRCGLDGRLWLKWKSGGILWLTSQRL